MYFVIIALTFTEVDRLWQLVSSDEENDDKIVEDPEENTTPSAAKKTKKPKKVVDEEDNPIEEPAYPAEDLDATIVEEGESTILWFLLNRYPFLYTRGAPNEVRAGHCCSSTQAVRTRP